MVFYGTNSRVLSLVESFLLFSEVFWYAVGYAAYVTTLFCLWE